MKILSYRHSSLVYSAYKSEKYTAYKYTYRTLYINIRHFM